jgi:multidrug efflux system outer membrane protein
MKRAYLWLAMVCGVVSACSVGPDFSKPDFKAPDAHRGQEAQAKSMADLPWWKVFKDPVLAGYLEEAVTKGYDVRVAAAAVENARASQRAAFWAFFPTLGAGVGFGGGQGFPGVPTIVPANTFNGNLGAYAGASWEVDVWGRLRRQKEAADAQVEASLADQKGVYVALVGDVASTYLQLRTYDLQLTITADAIKAREETLKLFTDRAKGGVGNDLEQARAEANLADAQARAENLKRAVFQTENALAVLLARPPGPIDRGTGLADFALPPQVPAGLPTALLANRPDLMSAEQQVHAATAVVGIKVGELFPKFQLSGSGGFATDLFSASGMNQGTTAVYRGAIGLEYTLPVLGGAQNLAAVDAAWARVHASVALYEKAATNALKDVSNALVSVEQFKRAREAQERQVAALKKTEELASMRYRGGVSNYLEVVTAQEQRLGAELALADAKGQQLQAVVQLYRALGGGWRKEEVSPDGGVESGGEPMKEYGEGPPLPTDGGR